MRDLDVAETADQPTLRILGTHGVPAGAGSHLIADHPEVVRPLHFHSAMCLHGHTFGGTNPSLVEALRANSPSCAHDSIQELVDTYWTH